MLSVTRASFFFRWIDWRGLAFRISRWILLDTLKKTCRLFLNKHFTVGWSGFDRVLFTRFTCVSYGDSSSYWLTCMDFSLFFLPSSTAFNCISRCFPIFMVSTWIPQVFTEFNWFWPNLSRFTWVSYGYNSLYRLICIDYTCYLPSFYRVFTGFHLGFPMVNCFHLDSRSFIPV